ncbi:MAG: hypothetical protein CMB61_06025 [Euryarchaeota archaeon]|nr:hypothetical protein [Euryarchaeota archaeon]|tara:strand:+ start:3028 stop:4236 length:1209 start_codon:yes stop_codon:yes gene_type:complete
MVLTVASLSVQIDVVMAAEKESQSNIHQVSPSSWNRFEECPRKYWLSRQSLPRKASMPASMGNAIHNSFEEICKTEISKEFDYEKGWFVEIVRRTLDKHWEIERDLFMEAPRHPRWKSELYQKALEGLVGSLKILFKRTIGEISDLSELEASDWAETQSNILANEATLTSNCGKLMGRLDLLISIKKSGKPDEWIVADLKTGKPPVTELDPKVSRQLRFYRDILKQNETEHPIVVAEGWYSANQTIHTAEGPSVIEEALESWERMIPTQEPLLATPSQESCSFCEWKSWCPSWWVARMDGEIPSGGMFIDEVVNLVRLDSQSGAALFQRAPPSGKNGELAKSNHRFGAILKDGALEQMKKIIHSIVDDPIFLGSARVSGKVLHLGDWSEILPWSPLLGPVSK